MKSQIISRFKFFVFDCLNHDMKKSSKKVKTSFCNFTQNNLFCHHPKIFKCSECGELMKYKKATNHPDFAILKETIICIKETNQNQQQQQIEIIVPFSRVPQVPIKKWETELFIDGKRIEIVSQPKLEILKSNSETDLKIVKYKLMNLNQIIKQKKGFEYNVKFMIKESSKNKFTIHGNEFKLKFE